jgi:acyl-coenzyme A synthetase/AMP-(fatty) acid ligase
LQALKIPKGLSILKGNFEELYKKILNGPDAPDEEFIISGNSFKEIYELASGIADYCISNAVKSLCLCTENKAVITAAILASAGGGAVSILPYSFNKTVIKEIRNAVGFDLILTDIPDIISSELKNITPEQIKIIHDNVLRQNDPDTVFLKIFTGGSTGKPRVWDKTIRNIFSEVFYHSNAFNITKKDIFVSSVPPNHIYGLLYSVLVPFVSYARAIGSTCLYPQEILSSVKDNSASVLVSIPMHYRVLKISSFDLPSLRLALSSAGSLDYADAEHFFEQTGVEVVEIFGSTETGGIAIRCNSGKDKPWKAFTTIEWKIQNERLSVRSEFISPDLSKDVEGYYLTEDRVETKDNNCFIYLGRMDGIVKIAGKRVDLNKIENKLKTIDGVKDAVVVAVQSVSGRKNIIAVLVEGTIDQPALVKAAKGLLESYELPRKIKIIDKIPIASAGKYDRQMILNIINSK